jgi:toxin CcdB
MAQWDVYPNPSARLRDEMPYLVDLQSNLLDALPTRLVAPLVRSRLAPDGLPHALCPSFNIDGVTLVLLPHEAGPIEARHLRRRNSSLRARAHDIVGALDAVVSGF